MIQTTRLKFPSSSNRSQRLDLPQASQTLYHWTTENLRELGHITTVGSNVTNFPRAARISFVDEREKWGYPTKACAVMPKGVLGRCSLPSLDQSSTAFHREGIIQLLFLLACISAQFKLNPTLAFLSACVLKSHIPEWIWS